MDLLAVDGPVICRWLMALMDSICRSIVSIRQDYSKRCNPLLLRSAQEFSSHYHRSGFTNVDVVARIAGLSNMQYYRIMNEVSLPKDPNELELARRRLSDHFGDALLDEARLHDLKRERAFDSVVSRLVEVTDADCLPVERLAKKSERITPPAHDVFRSEADFDSWVQTLITAERVAEFEADAIGKFLATRELLNGFADRLLDGAKHLIKSAEKEQSTDVKASDLRDHLAAITVALACFQCHGSDWDSLQKSLLVKAGMIPRKASRSEAIVRSLLSKWDLSPAHFLEPWTSVGYLVMESPIVRPLAIYVLESHQYK